MKPIAILAVADLAVLATLVTVYLRTGETIWLYAGLVVMALLGGMIAIGRAQQKRGL